MSSYTPWTDALLVSTRSLTLHLLSFGLGSRNQRETWPSGPNQGKEPDECETAVQLFPVGSRKGRLLSAKRHPDGFAYGCVGSKSIYALGCLDFVSNKRAEKMSSQMTSPDLLSACSQSRSFQMCAPCCRNARTSTALTC